MFYMLSKLEENYLLDSNYYLELHFYEEIRAAYLQLLSLLFSLTSKEKVV